MRGNELDDVLNNTLNAMAEVAKENGIISYQEFEILKQVRYDVNDYQNALKKALDDGIITSDENQILTKMKDDILKNVITVANFDKIVDDEEKGMIKKITEIINVYFSEVEDTGKR
ncbi:MAG: hypothetical protein HeimC2_08110 [Candidatus Heimdallarchaeota archaeon LC_2]|nr:MAG: hypothetical protein HeimC2_08110 [Candidatus Heimdallarchaeota archaeon LC_2]